MAYAMTKQGSLDNCITYEFICDTVADMNAIEDRYRSIGSVAIVLQGESDGLEVYIAGSDKNWNSLSSAGADSSATGGLSIYICGQAEVDSQTGLPDIEEPDETSIYLVPAGETSGNLYEEYIYVDEAWEKFGSANIDLSNYIQKTDIATQSTAGLVKVLDNGNVTFNENNQLVLTLAGTAVVKTGQSDHPISVTHQHEAAFYGLAKAAGQDMKNSGNAVGTYTTEAASAIRTMIGAGTYSKPAGGIPANDLSETYLTVHQDISGKANSADLATVATSGSYNDLSNKPIIPDVSGFYTKPSGGIPASDIASGVIPDISVCAPIANPAFTGSISLGRQDNTTIGTNSIAIGKRVTASGSESSAIGYLSTAEGDYACAYGYNVKASGTFSHAEGSSTIAASSYTHAEGCGTIASGLYTHVGGRYNVDNIFDLPEWQANTSYIVDDLVKITTNENNTITVAAYRCKTANNDTEFTRSHWFSYGLKKFAEIIGNGLSDAPSNARALDWNGNEYLMGDLYINCNTDSTGGTPIGARISALEAEITSLRVALLALQTEKEVTLENGQPLSDEQGNLIEYDTPTI